MEAASRLYDVAYQQGQRELMQYCEAALDSLEAEEGSQPAPNTAGAAPGAVQGGIFGEGVGTRANGVDGL